MAVLVTGDRGRSAVRRRLPFERHPLVARRRRQVLRRGRRAVIVLDRDRRDAAAHSAGGRPVRLADTRPRRKPGRPLQRDRQVFVTLVEGVVDEGERNRLAGPPDTAGGGVVLRTESDHRRHGAVVIGRLGAVLYRHRGKGHKEFRARTAAAPLPLRDDRHFGSVRALGEAIGLLLRAHGDRGMSHRRCRHRGHVALADIVHGPHFEGIGRPVRQSTDCSKQTVFVRSPCRPRWHRVALGVAVLVAGNRGTALLRRRIPPQGYQLVARRRRQVSGRGRAKTGRRLDPRFRPGSPGVHRPHLEAVERPVGQLPERARREGPRRNPGRRRGDRGACGAAHLVAGDGRAMAVRRRCPPQDDAAVFRHRRDISGNGRRTRRPLDLRRRSGSPGVHRPYLEAEQRPVGQLWERARRACSRRNPRRIRRNRVACGAAYLVVGDSGAAIARRRLPGERHLTVARRCGEFLRRERRTVIILDRYRHDATVSSAGSRAVRLAQLQPCGGPGRQRDPHLKFLVGLCGSVVDDGERDLLVSLPRSILIGKVRRVDANSD